MRRLYEWKLMNPSAGNTNNNSITSSTTTSSSSSAVDYKGKLKKLFDYHIARVSRNASSCDIRRLYEDPHQVVLEYAESSFLNTRNTVTKFEKEISLTYNKDTRDWKLTITPNSGLNGSYHKSGNSFNNLIDTLRPYV